MRAAAFVTSVLLFALAASPAHADKRSELPEIKSKAAVVLDADTGAEIFAKDADEVRAIASTTKIFVAMAVRKRQLDLDAWTAITREDAEAARGGSRTRLDIGQEFRNQDLLRAMLISSDNRAPTALGRAVGLSRDELIAAMNKLAKDLGLKRTKFTDSSGCAATSRPPARWPWRSGPPTATRCWPRSWPPPTTS
jgi:D-alanyl-D-alanine endopeptidase (penicillin-binding protein 7)